MRKILLGASFCLEICVSVPALGAMWYVDGSVSFSGDGQSWETAVKTIEEGIDLAYSGDTVVVAATGSPYSESLLNFGRKAITLTAQDGPDVTIVDAGGEDHGFRFASGETGDSALEGFAVRNARIGIECLNVGTSPTIKNCVVSLNGDGFSCASNSTPTLANCTVFKNTYGGITCDHSSSPTVRDCMVTENGFYGIACNNGSDATVISSAFLKNAGPGIRCRDSSPVIKNCSFLENEHGILCVDNSNPNVSGCTLLRNISSGVYCDWQQLRESRPTVASCLIADNGAQLGAGVYCDRADAIITNCTIRSRSLEQGADVFCRESDPTITNTILWGDSPRPMNWDPSSYPRVTYCVVRSGWLGEGNSDANPLFRDFGNGDFRLGGLSPCIDAGNNQATALPDEDVQGIHRIMYGGKDLKVDIGAYELHIWPPTLDPGRGDLILKWSSLTGESYSIYWSADMMIWELAESDVPSMGDTVTTWVDPTAPLLSAGVLRRYYRIIENE